MQHLTGIALGLAIALTPLLLMAYFIFVDHPRQVDLLRGELRTVRRALGVPEGWGLQLAVEVTAREADAKSDAVARAEAAEAERDEMRRDYEGACKTIAAMHEAATGTSGGPVTRGVVEDVADLRAQRDAWRHAATRDHPSTPGLCDLCKQAAGIQTPLERVRA